MLYALTHSEIAGLLREVGLIWFLLGFISATQAKHFNENMILLQYFNKPINVMNTKICTSGAKHLGYDKRSMESCYVAIYK
jgi:hypothetical protein